MKKIFPKIFLLILPIILMGAGCFSLSKNEVPKTTGPAGMFLSIDKGESWKAISLLPTAEGVQNLSGTSVYRLIEDPQDPKALYWATRDKGLFFSYDNGRTWQRPADTLNTGFVYSIAVHPVEKCTIFATDGIRVFRSSDCNRSWQEVYRESRDNIKINSISVSTFDPYRVYVAESNGDLLGSTDLGESWSSVSRFGTTINDVFCDPKEQGIIYLTTKTNGLYRSEDEGESWTNIKDQIKQFTKGLEYRRFVMHPTDPNKIYWISTYGILISEDKGETWEALKLVTPPGSVNIYGFDVNGDNDNEIYYTATSKMNRSTFYRSEDGGETWVTRKLPTGQIPAALRVHPENGDWVFIGFTIPPSK